MRSGRSPKRMIEEYCCQPHRFMTKLDADRRLWGGAVVALVEQQIERTMDSRQAGAKVLGACNLEQSLGSCEHRLGTGDALFDRGVAADKSAGDLVNAEATQNVENQRDLRLLPQPRMAAGKHHSKLVVLDGGRSKQFLDDGNDGPFAFKQARQLGRERTCGTLAAQDIKGAVLGRGHQPC